MKITRLQLKQLIKEEINRSRILSEGSAGDAALVYAQLNPKGGQLGTLQKAWELSEYDAILQTAAEAGITPESAFKYFTTPGEGLYGLAHTVIPMFKQILRDDGMLAALDFALKSGASFDIPGWDRMNPDLPFGEVDQFVMAKAGSGRFVDKG